MLPPFCSACRRWRRPIPRKPIRLVVGYSPGGGNDLIARIVAAKLQEKLGQPVRGRQQAGRAVDRGGRAGRQGAARRLHAAGRAERADDHQSRGLRQAALCAGAATSRRSRCSREFPLLLAVGAEQPIKTVRELVEYGRANPKLANYASSATPFQLAAELFNQRTGSKFQHIPYRGSGDAVQAVVAGQVLMTIADPGPMSGPLKAGKLRGAGRDRGQAQSDLSRRADHGRGRHPGHGDLAVDRHRGAGRHAARDRERCCADAIRRDARRCRRAHGAGERSPSSRAARRRTNIRDLIARDTARWKAGRRHRQHQARVTRDGQQQRGPPFGGALFPRRPERDRLRLPVLQLRHRPRAADRGHGRLQARRPQGAGRPSSARTRTPRCTWRRATPSPPAAARA